MARGDRGASGDVPAPPPAGSPPPVPPASPQQDPVPPVPPVPGPAGRTPSSTPPPAPSDSAWEGSALRHRTEETRTYPCTACGGELVFHIGQQRLACPHCGRVQELTAPAGTVPENDLRAALAADRADVPAHRQAGEREVVCQNCGGHTTFTGTWTAQRCPFCATPIQRDDVHDAPDRLPVDGVVPFAIDEDAAHEALRSWVGSRWFAPNEFKDYGRAGSFSSVYTAYFTFDAQTMTEYSGQRGDTYTVTVGSGQNRRTVTRVRWTPRRGTVRNAFDDVAVMANLGFDLKHARELEPWPLDQVRPFSHEYLAGHLARTYDHPVETCFGTARARMEEEIDWTVRRAIGGDQQRIHRKETAWSGLTFRHLLLPIWLLTVIYGGQTYQVLVNGVTGEVHGERPYSRVKVAFAVAAVALLVAVFLLLRSG